VDTCYGVRIHTTKTMREGERSWSVPSSNFYAGRKHGQLQTTTNHYQATLLSLALAEELVVKLAASGLSATVCDLFADPEAVIHQTMVEIGEVAPPPAPPPTTLQDLSKAIERCFREGGLSPLEVINHCNRVVLLG
jgi:hypothetical protein